MTDQSQQPKDEQELSFEEVHEQVEDLLKAFSISLPTIH